MLLSMMPINFSAALHLLSVTMCAWDIESVLAVMLETVAVAGSKGGKCWAAQHSVVFLQCDPRAACLSLTCRYMCAALKLAIRLLMVCCCHL